MPRPARLTPERIAAAALQIADQDGLEALSMRKIADALGVGAMSLYNHVRDKADLERLMLEAVFATTSEPRRAGAWQQRIRTVMRAIRDALQRHPGLVPLLLKRSTVSPSALRLIEEIPAALDAGGFKGIVQLQAYHALLSYLTGFMLTDLSGAMTIGNRRSLIELPDEVLQLDPAAFPHLRACAMLAGQSRSDEEFEFGLSAMLDGLKPGGSRKTAR